MRIYFDIDGTLTTQQRSRSIDKCPVRQDMVDKVKKLAAEGHEIILWSGNTGYAQRVAKILGIPTVACVGKPEMIVDNENVRWSRRLAERVITPEEFLKRDIAPPK